MSSSLHSEENQRLASWLKKQREARGMTMRELAERMQLPHSYIGKVEQRERRLDVVEYIHYCKSLGVSPIEGLLAIDKNLDTRSAKG